MFYFCGLLLNDAMDLEKLLPYFSTTFPFCGFAEDDRFGRMTVWKKWHSAVPFFLIKTSTQVSIQCHFKKNDNRSLHMEFYYSGYCFSYMLQPLKKSNIALVGEFTR